MTFRWPQTFLLGSVCLVLIRARPQALTMNGWYSECYWKKAAATLRLMTNHHLKSPHHRPHEWSYYSDRTSIASSVCPFWSTSTHIPPSPTWAGDWQQDVWLVGHLFQSILKSTLLCERRWDTEKECGVELEALLFLRVKNFIPFLHPKLSRLKVKMRQWELWDYKAYAY